MRWILLTAGLLMVPMLTAAAALSTSGPKNAAFALLVDDYLDHFGQLHPSISAGNGIHAHDGMLEDFSAGSVDREVRWLHAIKHRVAALDDNGYGTDERVDRVILNGVVDGWLLDLEVNRTWTRNPMIYVAAVSDGIHDLVTRESASPQVRLQHIQTKLQGVQALLAAARANIKAPPRIFVERAIAMLSGVAELLEHDMPLAFASVADQPLRDATFAEAHRARLALDAYRHELETRVLPRAAGNFAVGIANLEARYRAEELIDVPAARLLVIGARELAEKQREFKQVAARVDSTRPALDVWHDVQDWHPARGDLVPAARVVVNELFNFTRDRRLANLAADQQVSVAAAPPYDLGLASMHSSPPLEPHPVESIYYITDADAGWPVERQNAWLKAFNYATLADVSAHEVAPGHYVHSVYMQRTHGKIRRIWIGLNPFPQPSSGQDGWAHYAEQMVSDEGFHADDPRYRLAQIAESLTRICRLIAGIKLHSGEWSVLQAADFFEREGHLPAATAAREAARGTYDPTYGGYFLGKLAALKLRRDYQSIRGKDYSLLEFNESVMTNGIAPWWAHRQLLLPGDTGAVLE